MCGSVIKEQYRYYNSSNASQPHQRCRWGALYPLLRVRVSGGDTECPLQICQLSRSSESTHFLCLRSDVALFTRFHQSPGWLLRSDARASNLFPDYIECKTPALTYETHPNYLKLRIITGLSRPYLNTRGLARRTTVYLAQDNPPPYETHATTERSGTFCTRNFRNGGGPSHVVVGISLYFWYKI